MFGFQLVRFQDKNSMSEEVCTLIFYSEMNILFGVFELIEGCFGREPDESICDGSKLVSLVPVKSR
jgi:hypothetical protein